MDSQRQNNAGHGQCPVWFTIGSQGREGKVTGGQKKLDTMRVNGQCPVLFASGSQEREGKVRDI